MNLPLLHGMASRPDDDPSPQAPVPRPAGPSAQIERLREDPPFAYGDLRRRGVAFTQALSGETWTDYNHHDPGVTLLEAICYTLTEGVFAAQLPVEDLLAAPDGRLRLRRHALHAPERALPCRATTRDDLLRALLDRVPALYQLRLQMPRGDGVWQAAVRAPSALGKQAGRDLLRAAWAQRNLGEDFAAPVTVLRPQWCHLHLCLEVDGPRELGEVLTEVVRRCADLIAAAPRRQPLADRGETDPAALFDGPPMQHGWIADADLHAAADNHLHFSDLIRALSQVEGVAEISHLALESPGLVARDGTLPWQGDDWALQLSWPDSPEALRDWVVTRRGARLDIDASALLDRLTDAFQAGRLRALPTAGLRRAQRGRLFPAPQGHTIPALPYLSTWRSLPPLYRSAHSPPATDRAHAAQFAGYLAQLEQWLAHGQAQQEHLHALFDTRGDAARSYWWEPLDTRHLPGLADVHEQNAAERTAALIAQDPALERRDRVLDLLLGMHGESWSQNSLQRFGAYHAPAQWQAHLLECKRRLLLRIIHHTRDRHAAIDYSQPSVGHDDRTPPLLERIGLMLGMANTRSRWLAPALRAFKLTLDEAARGQPGPPPALEAIPLHTPRRVLIERQFQRDLAAGQAGERIAHYLPDWRADALPAALLRCAAHVEHYHLQPDDARQPLWLGPDEHGNWWPLSLRAKASAAATVAHYLHMLAGHVQREGEGLHLLEPLLLRPVDPAAPTDRLAHRLCVVFPGWTARGADSSFRALAAETVALSAPAHLLPTLHWLDAAQLAEFEHEYANWLAARRDHAQAQLRGEPGDDAALDALAAPLRRRLLRKQDAPA